MQNIVQVKPTYGIASYGLYRILDDTGLDWNQIILNVYLKGIDTESIPNIFHFNSEAWLNAKRNGQFLTL
jgi:hypothetical protein